MTKKKRSLLEIIEDMEKSGIHIKGLVFYDYSKITKKNQKPRKIVVIPPEEEANRMNVTLVFSRYEDFWRFCHHECGDFKLGCA